MDLVKAQALLSSGVPKSQIANVLGVSPSYISQLIEAGQLHDVQSTNPRDAYWDQLELTLLERAKDIVEQTTNPKAIIALLRLTNQAVRRGSTTNDIANNPQITNTIVSIQLPERVASKLTLDERKRLVAIDEKPILTIDKKSLESLVSESKNEQPQQLSRQQQELQVLDAY